MKDVLSGFFAMLTIWRYLIATTSTGKEFKKNYLLASLFFVLAPAFKTINRHPSSYCSSVRLVLL